jgi:hypothetical protein
MLDSPALIIKPSARSSLRGHGDGVKDLLFGVRLAIFDYLVLDYAALLEIGMMLVGEPVARA